MTELDWRASISPLKMLDFIEGRGGPFWERKLLLFACACLCQSWFSFYGVKVVEMVERFADGKASLQDVTKCLTGRDSAEKTSLFDGRFYYDPALKDPHYVIIEGHKAARAALRHAQDTTAADLLRDVLGPFPFRKVRMNRCWLTWQHGVIPAIAQEISAERAFERMPILGDALEDSGCTNEELIQHCRSGGPHALGCWGLDVVMCRGARKHRVVAKNPEVMEDFSENEEVAVDRLDEDDKVHQNAGE